MLSPGPFAATIIPVDLFRSTNASQRETDAEPHANLFTKFRVSSERHIPPRNPNNPEHKNPGPPHHESGAPGRKPVRN